MKKRKDINWPFVLMILVIVGYMVVYALGWLSDSQVIKEYEEFTSEEELAEQKEKSLEYNEGLKVGGRLDVQDVFAQGQKNAINLFNSQKPFGTVEAPGIGLKLPIYEGTSEKELQLGAAHLTGTSFPTGGADTRSVITAHRGLVNKRMFRDLDKLQLGDVFFIDTYGEKKAYEVFDKSVVLPSDTSSIEILPGEEVVTLLTCEPYMKNTHRLLVDGRRVDYDEKTQLAKTSAGEKKLQKRSFWDFLRSLSLTSLVDIEYLLFFALLVGLILRFIIKKVKKERSSS